MSLEIYKEPAELVFSGNPIIFGVKDLDIIPTNIEMNCIVRLSFQAASSSTSRLWFDYEGEEIAFTVSGKGAESLSEWVEDLHQQLTESAEFTDFFNSACFGTSIYIVEREVKGDIEAYYSIPYVSYDGSGYIEIYTIQESSVVESTESHLIGYKPARVNDVSILVEGGEITESTEFNGEGEEQESQVTYTDELDGLGKLTDGSRYCDFDMRKVCQLEQLAHFDLTEIVKKWDIVFPFKFYFYVKEGSPAVRRSGLWSNIIYVIQAQISQNFQAELNELGISIWQYLINTKKFLTWMPDNKIIDIYQPEILYFLAKYADTYTYRCKEYFSDGTDATHDIDSFTAQKYEIYQLSAAFLNVRSDSGKTLTKFQVWVENSSAEPEEVRTFIMSYDYYMHPRWWYFINGFVVYECMRTTGPAVKSRKIEKTFIEKDLPDNYTHTDKDYKQVESDSEYEMEVNSGPLTPEWSRYWGEFLDSEDVYAIKRSVAYPVKIAAGTYPVEIDKQNPVSKNFKLTTRNIDDPEVDLTPQLPIVGDYNGDFNESFYIGS